MGLVKQWCVDHAQRRLVRVGWLAKGSFLLPAPALGIPGVAALPVSTGRYRSGNPRRARRREHRAAMFAQRGICATEDVQGPVIESSKLMGC